MSTLLQRCVRHLFSRGEEVQRNGGRCLSSHWMLQFATKILATLSALDKEADSGAWFGAAERNESRLSLYNFLNSFIENAFMPSVFLDFK